MNWDTQTDQYQDILREVRQCFLSEDAPEYIRTLIESIQRQQQGQAVDLTAMMRAAHSIKGEQSVATDGYQSTGTPLETS
jgi:hypothetical protein